MARKPNYSFEKRRKEMDRKAKKDARREDKLRRKQEGEAGEAGEAGQVGEAGEAGEAGSAAPEESREDSPPGE